MKILLLILGILILISKKNSIKTLLQSKSKQKESLIKSFNDVKALLKDEKLYKGIMVFGVLIICLLYMLFYLLSSIFIGNFIFVVLSILLIIDTIKIFFKSLNSIHDINKAKFYGRFYRFINLFIDLGYIGFVFYTIYKRW